MFGKIRVGRSEGGLCGSRIANLVKVNFYRVKNLGSIE